MAHPYAGAPPKLRMIRQWISGDRRIYFKQDHRLHWYPQLMLEPEQRSFWGKDDRALGRFLRRHPQGIASLAAAEKALAACYRLPLVDRRLGRALLRWRPIKWACATRLGDYLYHRGTPALYHIGTPAPTAARRRNHGWQCGDLPYQLVQTPLANGWQVLILTTAGYNYNPWTVEFHQIFDSIYFATRAEALAALVEWRSAIPTKDIDCGESLPGLYLDMYYSNRIHHEKLYGL